MKTFIRGMTVPIKLEVRYQGTLSDPDSATCRVVDPENTKVVSDLAMTKTATGKYEYHYTPGTTATLGTYTVVLYATVGTKKYATTEKFLLAWA